MTEHSKLPWKLCGADGIYAGDDRGTKIAATRGGHTFHIDLCREEVEANAAFIVKACNAHEKLVAALEFIRDEYESVISNFEYRFDAYKAALDALASLKSK